MADGSVTGGGAPPVLVVLLMWNLVLLVCLVWLVPQGVWRVSRYWTFLRIDRKIVKEGEKREKVEKA